MNGRLLRPISRRTFLRRGAWVALAGAASVSIAGSAARALMPARVTTPLDTPGDRIAAVVPHRESAARVGRAALATRAVEPDARGLLSGLRDVIPNLADVLRDGSDDDIRAALDIARRQDFTGHADGLTRVEGWVVARTEARVCALVALASPA